MTTTDYAAEGDDVTDLPAGPFNVVYADPPWSYERSPTKRLNPDEHYDVMTIDDICALPVGSRCADDAVLFLWGTAPLLPEALRVVAAWGFAYRTSAVWDKERLGCGYWFRVGHEHLLVGVRGKVKPPAPRLRISSVLRAPRGRHSEKPGSVRRWIAEAFPAARRLEMFARHAAPGWTAWGNADRQRLLL